MKRLYNIQKKTTGHSKATNMWLPRGTLHSPLSWFGVLCLEPAFFKAWAASRRRRETQASTAGQGRYSIRWSHTTSLCPWPQTCLCSPRLQHLGCVTPLTAPALLQLHSWLSMRSPGYSSIRRTRVERDGHLCLPARKQTCRAANHVACGPASPTSSVSDIHLTDVYGPPLACKTRRPDDRSSFSIWSWALVLPAACVQSATTIVRQPLSVARFKLSIMSESSNE